MPNQDRIAAEVETLRRLIMAHSGEIRDAMLNKIKAARARGDSARAAIYETRHSEFERMLLEVSCLADPELLLRRYGTVGRNISAAAQHAIRTGRAAEAEMASIGDEMARIAEQFDD